MDLLRPFLPIDRCHALAAGRELPEHAAGAALFADVSGFTALSGALAAEQGGKRGAEELLSRLNRLYDPLIAIIHQQAGAVVGFAGDSITCWFDAMPAGLPGYPSAALRAVTAAERMQTAMRAFAPAPGEGKVALGIKVAVAAGAARRLAVGDPDYCLLDAMAGATLDRMAAAEQAAAAGEILVDDASHELLEANLVAGIPRPLGGSHGRAHPVLAVAACAPPSPWPAFPAQLSEDVTRRWVLPAVAERMAAGGRFLGELRQVVPLFASLDGIDWETDREAPARLDAWVRWAQATIAGLGGAVIQLTIGDKGTNLYAAFGAPVAHEDAADRAAAAAVVLQAPPDTLGFVPRTRIGISQGPVWTGACGSAERRCYGVMGEPVNLAARLMSHAPTGETLVDQRAARAAGRHRFSALSPLQVKGRPEPVLAATLIGRSMTMDVGGPVAAPLVGRETELALLEPLLLATARGDRGALVLQGAAGIGKSRLSAELMARAQQIGVRVLRGVGDPVERQRAYHAWQPVFAALLGVERGRAGDPSVRDAVLQRLRALGPAFERQAPLLKAVLPLDIEETPVTTQMEAEVRAANTLELLAGLVESLAGGPTLLLLEDAHWLDSTSWALLATLRHRAAPLLIAVVSRPLDELAAGAPLPPAVEELRGDPGTVSLLLEPLPAASAVSLACSRLGVDALPPRIAALIDQRAEGNPLYLEELVHALLEAGVIRVEERRCVLDESAGDPAALLPDTLEGLVTSRLDRLTPVSQRAAKVASVIGRVFPVRLLEAVYPVAGERSAIPAALEELARLEIARPVSEPEPSYTFKHAITHDAVYGTLLFAHRQELHRAVAEWYEGQGSDLAPLYPVLAHHWESAEAPAEAVRYGELAGEQALRSFANREAAAFFTKVLSRLDRLPAEPAPTRALRRARALRGLGTAAYSLGDTAEASSRLEDALAALGRPWPRTRPRLVGLLCGGVLRQAVHRLLPRSTPVPSARQAAERTEMAGALGILIRAYFPIGNLLGAVTANFEALNLAERAGEGAEVAGQLATAYTNVGATFDNAFGLHRIAAGYYERARAAATAAGNLHAIANLEKVRGMIYMMTRRLAEATEPFERSAALHVELGDARGWEEVCYSNATRALASGDLLGALALMEGVVASGRRRDSAHSCVLGLAQLALVLLRLGRLSEAEQAATESRAIRSRERYPAERIYAGGVLAWARALQGAEQDVLPLLEEIAVLAAEVGMSGIAAEGYVAGGEAAALLLNARSAGDVASRERLLHLGALMHRPLIRTARYMASLYTPPAERLAGAFAMARGQDRPALRKWRRSLALAASDGQRWDEAEAALALARFHPASAERDRHAARAHDLYTSMGAAGRLRRLDSLARTP
ncbi:MAG TPA: AAA family ATPase [Gemmatimonadales bacterium]|nr:AAA family ATPase [Gemmatimonadales bacterium]